MNNKTKIAKLKARLDEINSEYSKINNEIANIEKEGLKNYRSKYTGKYIIRVKNDSSYTIRKSAFIISEVIDKGTFKLTGPDYRESKFYKDYTWFTHNMQSLNDFKIVPKARYDKEVKLIKSLAIKSV